MLENEKLIKAAELLQENCRKYGGYKGICLQNGQKCIFLHNFNCRFLDKNCEPEKWELPAPPLRWNKKDTKQAEALKMLGFDRMIMTPNGLTLIGWKNDGVKWEYSAGNDFVFSDKISRLKFDEIIFLNDIIGGGTTDESPHTISAPK